MTRVDPVEIPNRSLFRQPEVCDIAKVQPYVLRSWEAEFPDLGVTKTEGGPRVYRRARRRAGAAPQASALRRGADARRRATQADGRSTGSGGDALTEVADLFGADARERILQVRRGLRELSAMLAKTPATRTESRRSSS